MKSIKPYFLSVIGFLLIVSNVYSQSEQLDNLFRKTNKIFLPDIENKIYDGFINNKWHNNSSSITVQSPNSDDTTLVDYIIGTLANGDRSRHTYTYDNNVDRTSYLYETWDGSQWVYFWHFTYTYNFDGNMALELFKRWNGSQLVNTLRRTFTYESNVNMTLELYEAWDGNQWINNSRYTYTNDFNGNRTSELYEIWEDSLWVNNRRETYTVDFSGNRIFELWELRESNQWVNYWRGTSTYDSNGNMISISAEIWVSGQWVNFNRATFTYDPNEFLTSGLGEIWDGNQWVNNQRSTYTYNANGNMILDLFEVWWNPWRNESRKLYTYDSNGNMILGLSESWVGGNWEAYDGWLEVNDSFGNISGSIASVINVFYGKLTDISENQSIISNYFLSQNYPNPFNPTTTIKYSIKTPLPKASLQDNPPFAKGGNTGGFVALKVYDILGKEVATLVDQKQASGNYEVNFNASQLSSGVYFYRLKTKDFTVTKKMILLE